jgi:transcriptional regulator with XRE-family HTH domain
MEKNTPKDSGASQSLGEYLRTVRTSRQFTLRDVEEAAEVSNAYLSQMEHDKIVKPSPHILYKLAEFYQVPYELLMQKAGYIKPGPGKTGARPGRVAASALGKLTRDEEEELLKYLAFIRSQKQKE